jgi:hypothetical protein
MMGAMVYVIATGTSAVCATLLMRGYFRGRKNLLLWSGLCFAGLTISNLLIFIDLALIPDVDLYGYRLATAAVAMLLLLYGLIWESE